MLRFLVVDDEPWQVKALAGIIQGMKPDCMVKEAFDGAEALELLDGEPFDAVITDIRMPGMDGLELIEKLVPMECRPEFVILSGYGEFQYARKAIQFGVSEYLLKPVSKQDIEGMLERIEKKCERKMQERNHRTGIAKKLESTLPVYIEHQLNRLVDRDFDAAGLQEILEIIPKSTASCALAVKIRKYGQLTSIYTGEEINRLFQHFKFRMKESLDSIGHSISFFYEKSRNIMITLLVSDTPPNWKEEKNTDRIRSFLEYSKNELGIGITVGISGVLPYTPEHLGECSVQALEALEYELAAESCSIIFYPATEQGSGKERPEIRSFETELSNVVQKPLDRMSAKRINDVFEKHAARISAVKSGKLKESLYFMAVTMAKNLKHMLEESHFDALTQDIRECIYESGSYVELKHGLMDYAAKLAEYSLNKENRNNYHVVQKCKKFIEEHYMEDLSLELVAGRFHFSPSYFSNLFKNYAGVGFSEFVLSVRMEKAQFLLKNTGYKVYDISEKVGYRDPTYFNRIFKREVGVSPYRFRQVSSEF